MDKVCIIINSCNQTRFGKLVFFFCVFNFSLSYLSRCTLFGIQVVLVICFMPFLRPLALLLLSFIKGIKVVVLFYWYGWCVVILRLMLGNHFIVFFEVLDRGSSTEACGLWNWLMDYVLSYGVYIFQAGKFGTCGVSLNPTQFGRYWMKYWFCPIWGGQDWFRTWHCDTGIMGFFLRSGSWSLSWNIDSVLFMFIWNWLPDSDHIKSVGQEGRKRHERTYVFLNWFLQVGLMNNSSIWAKWQKDNDGVNVNQWGGFWYTGSRSGDIMDNSVGLLWYIMQCCHLRIMEIVFRRVSLYPITCSVEPKIRINFDESA